MPIPLIALMPLEYDGRRVPLGARFLVRSIEDAHILKYLGRAADAPVGHDAHDAVTESPPVVKAKRTYTRRTAPKGDGAA